MARCVPERGEHVPLIDVVLESAIDHEEYFTADNLQMEVELLQCQLRPCTNTSAQDV